MTIPSPKSPKVEAGLEAIFGRTTAIENNKCTSCGGRAESFSDQLSAIEYTISGLCQGCQNKVYSGLD